MVRASSIVRLSAMLLLVIVARVSAVADEEPRPAPFDATVANQAQNDTVEHRLEEKVSIDFQEETLVTLVSFLVKHNVNAVIDIRALEDAGLGDDAPLRKLKVSEISLRSVLDLLLDGLDLEPIIRDGKLVITTAEAADVELVTRIYRVDDLVRKRTDDGEQFDDNDSLIELITTTVSPQTWNEVGGPAMVSEFQGALVISQIQPVHREIEWLLAALRESRTKRQTSAAPEPIWAASAEDSALWRKFTDKSTVEFDFQFVEEPLEKATATVADRFGLQAVLDTRALEDAGIGMDTPITADLHEVTLPASLAFLLGPLDMTYVLKNEVILVTTRDAADQELVSVVYPVADLVQYGEPRVGARHQDFNSLVEVVTAAVKPSSWAEVGGPGSICEFPITSSLVISQTQPIQQEITRLMSGLRKMRAPLPHPPHRPAAGGGGGGVMGGRRMGGGMF